MLNFEDVEERDGQLVPEIVLLGVSLSYRCTFIVERLAVL